MAWRLTKSTRSLDSSEWPQNEPQNSRVDVRAGDAIENHVRKLEDGQVDDVLPDDTEDRDAVRGMASPETREVVRSALRKVPCFINLDDEKKFSYGLSVEVDLELDVWSMASSRDHLDAVDAAA